MENKKLKHKRKLNVVFLKKTNSILIDQEKKLFF